MNNKKSMMTCMLKLLAKVKHPAKSGGRKYGESRDIDFSRWSRLKGSCGFKSEGLSQ